jgi:hypothetical protein
MGLGGREPEEGGHRNVNFSLDEATRKILAEAKEKGKPMSKLVEKCIANLADQFDPGNACPTIAAVTRLVEEGLDKARSQGDFEQVQALAQFRAHIDPYAAICQIRPGSKEEHC